VTSTYSDSDTGGSNSEAPVADKVVRKTKRLDIAACHPPLHIDEWDHVGFRRPLRILRCRPEPFYDVLQ